MHRFVSRLVPSVVAASLLAACSGGGGGGMLPTSSALTPDLSAPSPGDFVATSDFSARGDENSSIRFLPANDGLWKLRADGSTSRGGAAAGGNLAYGGGPIQTAPKTYVVFWGKTWTSSSGDPDHAQAYLASFLSHVGGSAWNSTVTQYYQTNPSANAGNPANNYGGSYVDTASSPSKKPSQSAMAAEAARAAAHFGDYSVNAQYVVAMPHGVSPSGFKSSYCAYHANTTANGSTIAWTNLPYLPDAGSGCGAASVTSSNLDGYSIVEGHEMAETETDPQPSSGWVDSSGSEIGDKCAWVNLQDTNLNGTSFPTQPLWSNAISGCAQ